MHLVIHIIENSHHIMQECASKHIKHMRICLSKLEPAEYICSANVFVRRKGEDVLFVQEERLAADTDSELGDFGFARRQVGLVG